MKDKNARSLAIQRTVLTVLALVLAILLVLVAADASRAASLRNQPQETEAQLQSPTENTATEPPLPMFTEPQVTVAEVDFGTGPQIEAVSDEIINILLIGQDSAVEGARSDTILLCSFNKEKNTVAMISFLRDMYVRIPGYGKDRINAAYSLGGAELLSKTLYENFGIEVDGNLRVDFARFRDIIDLLGGVKLNLTAAEAAFVNKHVSGSDLPEGESVLNGKQALMYARNRHDADGDFSRTNRQRKLIRALISTYKSKPLAEMLGLVNEILPMISTDISKRDMIAYAVTLFPMLEEAEFKTTHIPISGGYYHETIDEKSVLVPYMEKNKKVIAELIG